MDGLRILPHWHLRALLVKSMTAQYQEGQRLTQRPVRGI